MIPHGPYVLLRLFNLSLTSQSLISNDITLYDATRKHLFALTLV